MPTENWSTHPKTEQSSPKNQRSSTHTPQDPFGIMRAVPTNKMTLRTVLDSPYKCYHLHVHYPLATGFNTRTPGQAFDGRLYGPANYAWIYNCDHQQSSLTQFNVRDIAC